MSGIGLNCKYIYPTDGSGCASPATRMHPVSGHALCATHHRAELMGHAALARKHAREVEHFASYVDVVPEPTTSAGA